MTLIRASLAVLLAVPLVAQGADRLEGQNVSITQTNFKGRSAIQLIATPDAQNATSYAVIKDVLFRDGAIEAAAHKGPPYDWNDRAERPFRTYVPNVRAERLTVY